MREYSSGGILLSWSISFCAEFRRVAFAFDPKRRAVILVAGDKAGVSQKRFYRNFIRRADERFDRYLSGGEEHVQNT
ncbi:type II toxin-antitoxin system RelE/ParE family toxin [Pseudomonas sp. SORT22]|nr:type II toxin-antitoxin system RelE/ParE family toxin [Pseudomonas sp. SORT22]